MKNIPLYFQQGGAAPQPQATDGGGDPQAQLQAMLQQYAQSRDPQLAVQICDMLVQAMGGGQQQQAPADPAQQAAFKQGGKIGMTALEKLKAERAKLFV